MITLTLLFVSLLFYWKPIYYALRASWLYYKVGEDDLEYIKYRTNLIDWSRQAWGLIKP